LGAIAEAMGLYHVSKYIAVPLFAFALWLLLYKGGFQKAEKIFLVSSALYLVYIATAFIVKPDWSEAVGSLFKPQIQLNREYMSTLMVLIGTTVTIWGQFFIQAFVVDKGIPAIKYGYQRLEIYIGAFFTDLISFFIIVTAANTLYINNIAAETASDAALALKPLAGVFASQLFAFGLLNAGLLGVSIVTLATAYAICEAFGFESKMDRTWKQAPVFYWIITVIIAVSAFLVMLPGMPLYEILIFSNNVNGVILPVIMVYVYQIANDAKIMGQFKNTRRDNILASVSIVILTIASISLIGFTLFT